MAGGGPLTAGRAGQVESCYFAAQSAFRAGFAGLFAGQVAVLVAGLGRVVEDNFLCFNQMEVATEAAKMSSAMMGVANPKAPANVAIVATTPVSAHMAIDPAMLDFKVIRNNGPLRIRQQ